MKNIKNTKTGIIGLISGAAALALALWFKRNYKKEQEKLVAEKKAEDNSIRALGISPERMREEVLECKVEEDRNLVKALYVAVDSNPDFDKNVVSAEEYMKKDIIHVTEDCDTHGNKYLTFLFEIPDYARERGNYNELRIGDYFRGMSEMAEHVWGRIIKYCPKPQTRMSVFLGYSYKDPFFNKEKIEEDKEYISELVEVPRNVWEKWETDAHDGLIEFYEDCYDRGDKAKAAVNDLIEKVVFEKYSGVASELKEPINPRYEDVRLMYRVSFRERSDTYPYGVTLESGIETLKWLLSSFKVCKKGKEEKTEALYDNIMFHAPNYGGEFDSLTRYYTTDERTHDVIATCYGYR